MFIDDTTAYPVATGNDADSEEDGFNDIAEDSEPEGTAHGGNSECPDQPVSVPKDDAVPTCTSIPKDDAVLVGTSEDSTVQQRDIDMVQDSSWNVSPVRAATRRDERIFDPTVDSDGEEFMPIRGECRTFITSRNP